jgi:hypothetical protein
MQRYNPVTKVHCGGKWVATMNLDVKRRMTFPLRLAISLKDVAAMLARKDGVSLNNFISIAVAEKISRLESEELSEHHALAQQHRLALATEVINKTLYS